MCQLLGSYAVPGVKWESMATAVLAVPRMQQPMCRWQANHIARCPAVASSRVAAADRSSSSRPAPLDLESKLATAINSSKGQRDTQYSPQSQQVKLDSATAYTMQAKHS